MQILYGKKITFRSAAVLGLGGDVVVMLCVDVHKTGVESVVVAYIINLTFVRCFKNQNP